jgi:3-hydroxybutyrate dehydrogenase
MTIYQLLKRIKALMSTRKFEGKVAVVTGSTSGIGKAIVERLASLGCHIVVNGFGDKAQIDAQVAKLAADHAVKVIYHGADVTKSADINDLVAKTVETFGSIDILVNCAGIQRVHPIEEFPEAEFDAVIATNLKSVYLTTKAALPHMRKKGFGRIINIASAHGHVGSAGKIAYVGAKHAVIGMTKVTGIEIATGLPKGQSITVNSISPGWVMTPLVEQQIRDKAKALQEGCKAKNQAVPSDQDAWNQIAEDMLEKQVLREFTPAEAIAGGVEYLCSEDARTMIGEDLAIDGGWKIH